MPSPLPSLALAFLLSTVAGCTDNDSDTGGDAATYTYCSKASDCMSGQVCCPVVPTGTPAGEAGSPCTGEGCFGTCENASAALCVAPTTVDAAADSPADASDGAAGDAADSTVDGPTEE